MRPIARSVHFGCFEPTRHTRVSRLESMGLRPRHDHPSGIRPAAVLQHFAAAVTSAAQCSLIFALQVASLMAETIVTVCEINATAVPSRIRARYMVEHTICNIRTMQRLRCPTCATEHKAYSMHHEPPWQCCSWYSNMGPCFLCFRYAYAYLIMK